MTTPSTQDELIYIPQRELDRLRRVHERLTKDSHRWGYMLSGWAIGFMTAVMMGFAR
jgi:hypothetical protein